MVEWNDTPLRVAVVGYGYWGPNLVRNVIERPELELAGLCERDPERAAAFSARNPGAPVYAELDELLAQPDVDAILVATPPMTHHAVVKAAPLRIAQRRAAMPSGPSVEMCSASGRNASINRASLRPGSRASRMSG